MPRLSSFLTAPLGLCLSLSAFPAQPAVAQSTSSVSSVEVVYIVSDYTLLTFDVDRQTGFPTEEGQGVTLPAGNAALVPSADDHFVYVTGYDSQLIERLWVYSTDSTGVPQLPAIQEITLPNQSVYAFQIDPTGELAYAVEETRNSNGESIAEIRRFNVDPTTGRLTLSPRPVATFPPNGPCAPGSYPANFVLDGFSADGSKLYDSWSCSYPDSVSAFYSAVRVNQQTGALGPSAETIRWIDGSQGADYVNITPTAILYFSIPNYINQGLNSLSVYPLSGGTQPRFTCTAAMLEACGYGLSDWVDPLGTLRLHSDRERLDRDHEIGDGGKAGRGHGELLVPGIVLGFSPDDVLVYSENVDLNNPYFLPIYVFDPATGGITYNGGQIMLQSVFASVVPALRQ